MTTHDTSTETARRAADLGLPKVAWQEGGYRLVLCYNDENDTIERIPERLCGYDALGHERWESLAGRTWDAAHNTCVVTADWEYLARQMACSLAPLPDGTEDEGEHAQELPAATTALGPAFAEALVAAAADAIRRRSSFCSDWGQIAHQLELAALDKVARAVGLMNLEERALDVVRRIPEETNATLE